jgi:hypothetical protein
MNNIKRGIVANLDRNIAIFIKLGERLAIIGQDLVRRRIGREDTSGRTRSIIRFQWSVFSVAFFV